MNLFRTGDRQQLLNTSGTAVVVTINWVQPSGVEIYEAGGVAEIVWTTDSTALELALEYSPDDGANWVPQGDVPNLGTHMWDVDLGATAEGRLKLTDAVAGVSAVSERFVIELPA